MNQLATLLLMAVLVSQAFCAPQLINFNDGKLGVNFGGYHAAVGLGGLLGQNGGAGGGLFAEAGTPYGQAAKAGLGGTVDGSGGSAGGLYAGATAGGNVKASTGLSGGVTAEKTAGTGFASAQAGKHYASAGLGGETSDTGASGFTFSGKGVKTFSVNSEQVDSTLEVKPIEAEHKKTVNKEFNVDAGNEINFVPLAQKGVTVKSEVQPQVIVKEVYVQSPPQVVEKHIFHTHTKPRHHFRKTAYIGGYLGGAGALPIPPQKPIEKRVDVGVEAEANLGAAAATNAGVNGNFGQTYTKQVTFQRNPNFFADIFNIPISTLRAVGNLLSNTAGSTSVSVQKSGSIQAETDSISPKHAASSASSSEAHISVQTPSVPKVIDDIFAIPINTLGAVNKFLENNVPARKAVQVSADGSVEPAKVRLGPYAKRRANKQVVIVQEENVQNTE